ncbi:hypothetical protein B9Y82_15655 [Stenotrophomonas maltophilia]|nr:hypothetical protein B9Y82_15655 [Stenotrophomonas maltophilia]
MTERLLEEGISESADTTRLPVVPVKAPQIAPTRAEREPDRPATHTTGMMGAKYTYMLVCL